MQGFGSSCRLSADGSQVTTDTLAQDLKGVDPKSVPATRQTGPPSIQLRIEGYVRVTVPMDTGTLILKIFKDEDRWLVSEVDWDQT